MALRLMAENWLSAAKATLAQPSAKEAAPGGGQYRTLISPNGGTMTVMTGGGFNRRPAASPGVPEATLLENSPLADAGRWAQAVDSALRPALLAAQATLLSRDDRAPDAVGFVRKLAETEPAAATALTPTLLKNWSVAANPNPKQDDQQSQYAMMYGGGGQPQTGIALTRLRQERNLRELAAMLARTARRCPAAARRRQGPWPTPSSPPTPRPRSSGRRT